MDKNKTDLLSSVFGVIVHCCIHLPVGMSWDDQVKEPMVYNYHLDGQLTIGVMDSSNQNYLHHTVLLSKIWDLKERIILRTISLSHKFYHSFSDTRGEKPLHMVRYFTIRGDKKSHRVSEKLSGNYDDETK